eukprot:tig00000057_g124.t1
MAHYKYGGYQPTDEDAYRGIDIAPRPTAAGAPPGQRAKPPPPPGPPPAAQANVLIQGTTSGRPSYDPYGAGAYGQQESSQGGWSGQNSSGGNSAAHSGNPSPAPYGDSRGGRSGGPSPPQYGQGSGNSTPYNQYGGGAPYNSTPSGPSPYGGHGATNYNDQSGGQYGAGGGGSDAGYGQQQQQQQQQDDGADDPVRRQMEALNMLNMANSQQFNGIVRTPSQAEGYQGEYDLPSNDYGKPAKQRLGAKVDLEGTIMLPPEDMEPEVIPPGVKITWPDAVWNKFTETQKWRRLTRFDKVKLYYPGVTMEPKDKQRISFPNRVNIGMFGRRGFGKSSFIESALHIWQNLPFTQFYRQGPSDESFTRKRDVAEVNPYFALVDFPGMLNMGDDWVRSVLIEVEDMHRRNQACKSKFIEDPLELKGRRYVKLQGAIIFWDAEAEEHQRLVPLVAALEGLMGKRPVVVVTKIDKLDHATVKRAINGVYEACKCPVFGVANYTYDSQDDDPDMNGRFADVLACVLKRADRCVVYRAIKRLEACNLM